MKFLIFDIEYRRNPSDPDVGWRNYDKMGISFAGAYCDWKDEYKFYGEDELMQLIADMHHAEVISGFNVTGFDWPLLEATLKRTGTRVIEGWDALLAKTYDPLLDVCQHLGVKVAKGWNLDNISKSNLSIFKNGSGADAPGLWEKGRIGQLVGYLSRDLQVETHLFRHCRDYRNLKNRFIKLGEEVVVPLRQMDALAKKHGF